MVFLRRTRHVASIVTLFAAISSCALAQSSGPSERKQDDASAKRQQETIEQLKAISSELSAIRDQQARTEQREAAEEAKKDEVFGPSTWSNWVLAGFAAVAAIIAALSLRAIEKQAIETEKAAKAAKTSADALHVIECAYISVSHNPPGVVVVGQTADGVRLCRIEVGVVNHGNTPARVHRVEIFAHESAAPLPNDPPYGTPDPQPTQAYLVRNEQIFAVADIRYTEPIWAEITAGRRKLWILGYVDYTDTFDQSHRAGYARRYVPGTPNNLVLEPQPGYNYDKKT